MTWALAQFGLAGGIAAASGQPHLSALQGSERLTEAAPLETFIAAGAQRGSARA